MSSSLIAASSDSKKLAIYAVFFLVCGIGLSAYLVSFLKDKISKNLFTISQSLAFGNKLMIITLLTIGFAFLSKLVMLRGSKYLWIRLFLLLVMYSFIITILWVTTYYNEKDHYILALFAFLSLLVYVTLTSMALYQGTFNKTAVTKAILIGLPILCFMGILGLSISNLDFVRNKITELFPSFENYTVFIFLLSIIILGYI